MWSVVLYGGRFSHVLLVVFLTRILTVSLRFVNFRVFCDNNLHMKTTSKKIRDGLADVARDLGISEEEVLQEAVSSYRARIASSDLRSELLMWDAASVEDFAQFEKNM